ncbi:MAG: NAD(P)H-binding protein [Stackebrandtia sp.]
MILVTGTAGALGTLITRELADHPSLVAGSRQPDRPTGGIPARRIDFDDPSTLASGFDGVDVLVMISAGYAEDDIVQARYRNVVVAAEAAGVRQIVYTSLSGTGEHLSIVAAHRYAERLLRDSTMDVTILRNGLYAELFADVARQAAASGALTAPMGDGAVACVAREDLARVAARVAVEAEADAGNPHRGRCYELAGVEAVDARRLAAAVSKVSGREIELRPVELTGLRDALAATGLRPFEIGHTISMFSNIAAGFLGDTTTDLARLLPGDPLPVMDIITAAVREP